MKCKLTWIHFICMTTMLSSLVMAENKARHLIKHHRDKLFQLKLNNTKIVQVHNNSTNSSKPGIRFKEITKIVQKTIGRSGGLGILLARDILVDITDFLDNIFFKKEVDYISEEDFEYELGGDEFDLDESFEDPVIDSAEDDLNTQTPD